MGINTNVLLGIVLATLFGALVILSTILILCRFRKLRKRETARLNAIRFRRSAPAAPPTSPRPDQELQISVITTTSTVVTVPGVQYRYAVREDCPQCSYTRPQDVPPPSYYDIVPREAVEDMMKQIFDPPDYAEMQRTSRSREELATVQEEAEVEEELPTYNQVFDRDGCYVNQALELDSDDAIDGAGCYVNPALQIDSDSDDYHSASGS